MNTTDNNQYKSIEVGNQTIIMDETQAFRILNAMRDAFGWVGSEFTESDIRHSIADRRDADDKEPYTDDQMDKAVATIMDSYSWTRFMEEWMCKEGFEVLNNAIFDELEWPEEKARQEQEA
jgi:hypothetical protein